MVGELGEYYAIEFYNSKDDLPELTQAEAGLKNVNAFLPQAKSIVLNQSRHEKVLLVLFGIL